MDQYHRSHKKKVGTGTGGRMGKPRDKKLSHMGRPFANTKIRENEDRVTIRLRGGKTKQKLKKALMAFASIVKKKSAKSACWLGQWPILALTVKLSCRKWLKLPCGF